MTSPSSQDGVREIPVGKYAAGRGSQSPRGTSRETGHGSAPLPCPFSHYVPPSWLELVMASDLQIRLSSPPWLGTSTTPPLQPPYPSAPFPQPGNPALTWTPSCPGPCPLERSPPALPSLAPAHLRPYPVTPPVWTTLGSKKLQQYQFHRLLNPGPTLTPQLTAGSEA